MDTAWLYHLCGWHILIHTIFPSVLDTTEHQRSQSTLCWNSPKKQVFIQFPVKNHFKPLLQKMDHLFSVLCKPIHSPRFGLLSTYHTRSIIMTNIIKQWQTGALCLLIKGSWNNKGLKKLWKLLKLKWFTYIYCTRYNNQSEQKVEKCEVWLHVPMESCGGKMQTCSWVNHEMYQSL